MMRPCSVIPSTTRGRATMVTSLFEEEAASFPPRYPPTAPAPKTRIRTSGSVGRPGLQLALGAVRQANDVLPVAEGGQKEERESSKHVRQWAPRRDHANR